MARTPSRRPAEGDAAILCPRCGWFLRVAVAGEANPPCAGCAYYARQRHQIGRSPEAVPVPAFTTTEVLYLATALLRDEAGAARALEHEDTATRFLLSVAARVLTERLSPNTPASGGGPTDAGPRRAAITDPAELPAVPADPWTAGRLPLGTSPLVLRAWVTRLASAWRAKQCPIAPPLPAVPTPSLTGTHV